MKFEIRNYVVAHPGCILVEFDYSSEEYKLLGHYGNDDNFMRFIHEGKDIHTATAGLCFGMTYEEVTKEYRQKGKSCNFGLLN